MHPLSSFKWDLSVYAAEAALHRLTKNLYVFLCRNFCNLKKCVNYNVESVLMSGKASDSVHTNLNTEDAPECNSLATDPPWLRTVGNLKASWFRCILHNLNLYVHLQFVSLPTMPNKNKNSNKITKQTKKTLGTFMQREVRPHFSDSYEKHKHKCFVLKPQTSAVNNPREYISGLNCITSATFALKWRLFRILKQGVLERHKVFALVLLWTLAVR